MKFGRLANTWSSKNATCRGGTICYINLFYTCMICMFLPCGGHVQTMCKPCANQCKPVQTMCEPCGNHMKTMWGPCGNHMKTMCKQCANHAQTTWEPHENHVGAMWKPHENHVGRQCPGGPKSQIPRPNQGFQMKFGRLANTWSSKNATCRGDPICYINLFYTCMIFLFLLKFM